MRKYKKFLAMILMLALMLRVSPLATFGDDFVQSGLQDPANTQPYMQNGDFTHEGDDPRETEFPDKMEPDIQRKAPVSVNLIEWRLDGSNHDFKSLTQGDTIEINRILFRLTLSEKATSVSVKISGVDVQVVKVLNFAFFNPEIINGNHEMEITVTNAYGTTVERVRFFVDSPVSYPTFEWEVPANLLRGESADLTLTGRGLEDLECLKLVLDIDPAFDVEDVILGDGISGMYIWYRGVLHIEAEVADASSVTDDVLATIRVRTPAGLRADGLRWSVRSCEATMSENSNLGSTDGFIGEIDMVLPDVGVSYPYFIETSGVAYKGMSYTLRVRHYDGTYAAYMDVYTLVNGEQVPIGRTDADGCLTTTYLDTYDSYNVCVMGGDEVLSETVEIECLLPEGEPNGIPYGVIMSAPVATGKTFSWMSGIAGSSENAILRLATKEDMSDAIHVIGTSRVAYYNGGTSLNRINRVTVTDLTDGEIYYYQVGDGIVWGEVDSFTVRTYEGILNFAVFGGYADSSDWSAMAETLHNGAFDFTLQIGHTLAASDDHDALADMLGAMSVLETDLLHTLSSAEIGNSTLRFLYGLDDSLFYSYEIGNVFVAVVNAEADNLAAALDAVYTDAKASDAAWKFLSIHTPVYSVGADSNGEQVAAQVSCFAERAGIDVVFSGATCGYSRTESLRGGVPTEKNGVTYISVGSLGGENGMINADGFAFATNEFNEIYVSVHATVDRLVITAYDVAEDGAVSQIDTVTKIPYFCVEEEHNFRMHYDVGCLICDRCDTRASVTTYVGPVYDGETLKFLSKGIFKSGWQVHLGKTYYLRPDTLTAVDGEAEIGGYTYLFEEYCLKIGAWFERDGVWMLKWAGVTQRQTWITMDGKTYYFDQDGRYLIGVTPVPVVRDGVTVMEYHRFDQNGIHQGMLADGLYVDEELIIYTVNGIAQHKGLVMDEEGNFYYIGSSREGVRGITRYVDPNWTNGLLPAGTYTFGMDGKMVDPPETA